MHRCRTTLAISLALALALGTLLPATARADHDFNAKVSFWAFSADGRHVLLFVEDENRGNTLLVRRVGKQAPVYQVVIGDRQAQDFLAVPPLSTYRFLDGGVPGPDSPDANSKKILTTPGKGTLDVFMTNGDVMLKLFGIPLRRDPSNTVMAVASLKQIVWTSNGASVVLILNQKLEAEYGLDVDQVISLNTMPFRKALARRAAKGPAAKKPKKRK
jgi:ABC-type glycerol-3-phosphate transport system substrate-binding protein